MKRQRPVHKADNNKDIKTVAFPLFDLPKDARDKEIYSNFSVKEFGLFAQTSIEAEQATAFLRLLTSAVDAEPESYEQEDETRLAAIAILKRHPELLFKEGTVTDHYGRKFLASPYRLFLGAGDTWAIKQIHKEIIPNIEDGEAQAQAAYKKQFPNCPCPFDPDLGEEQFYDDRNKKQIEEVIAQLKIIAGKIAADPCIDGLATLDETKQAVADLCKIFAPNEGEIIKTGLHFPPVIMKEIYKAHNDPLNFWHSAQSSFFSRTVIGSALAASTAVDGQCYKTGLKNLDMEKGPDRRDGLFCRYPKGIPKRLTPINNKLGSRMFVDIKDGFACVLSTPGNFDWFNKKGRRKWFGCVGVIRNIREFDNLQKTKDETYASCFAIMRREVNMLSQGA